MKKLLRRIFLRTARLLGVRELQELTSNLATELHQTSEKISNVSDTLRHEMAELERLIDNRVGATLREHVLRLDELVVRFDSHVDALQAQIEHTRVLSHEHVENYMSERIEATQSAILSHVTKHSEELAKVAREHTETYVAGLRRDLDLIRSIAAQTTNSVGKTASTTSTVQSEGQIDDAFYVSLEDHFRGNQSTIRTRQMQYLSVVTEKATNESPLVDFGCGRGEWLEICRDAGIPARGYDSNQVSVNECMSKGLRVQLGDLFEVLDSTPDGSLGVVTFFQVFEHLPFSVLLSVLRSCRRVLRDGGVLIAEVPNSETLLIGASTFWIDPTHQRPLHPEVLRFLAKQVGFSGIDSVYSTPLQEPFLPTDIHDPLEEAVKNIHRTLFGPGDFALIATV